VKILDFGIAKAAKQVEQTGGGEIKGKLSYMSPEQARGQPLDQRSDLFSLAVLLYEWITGFKLFTGESDVAVLKAVTDGKIYKPSYFKQDVPEPVEAILMKALEKDREKRYPSAWDMQYDIDRFLSNNEFSPSNIHLANFLRQLFKDELEAERDRLLSSGAPLEPAELTDQEVEELVSGAPPRPQETPPPNGALPVVLAPTERQLLEQMAKRHQMPVADLVAEIVKGYLKFK
jgi:serine/threonine-protein kinase